MTIDHELTLHYHLQPGWMAKFTDGLSHGQAVALQCTHCRKVSFPPCRTCDCGEVSQDWVQLSGTADIHYHCEGQDGQFALVQFHGASTMSVVRLEGFTPQLINAGKLTGEIRPLHSVLPALVLYPTGDAR